MKFAKKALALLLAMLMMFALVACGGDEDTTSDASNGDDNAVVDSDFWDDVSASQNDQQELDDQDTGKTTTTKKDSGKKTTVKLTTGTKKQTVEVKEFPTIKYCKGEKCDAEKHTVVRVMTTSDVAAKQYYKDKLKSEYKLSLKEEYVEWGAIPEKLAAAEIAKNSPDAVRYRADNPDLPGLMVDNLVQPVDSMVDFSLPLYKELLPYYKTTLWDNKHYLLIDQIGMGAGIYYDTKVVKQYAGVDPWELFKAGKWDWNKFAEVAEKIKDDTDGDGEQDLYAFSIGIAPSAFLYTTGTTFGILDNKGKTIKNNIKSAKIARGMNFLLDLGIKKKTGMMNPGTASQNFYDGKAAMQICEWGDYLGMPNYKDTVKMAKAGRLGMVPMPKDPEADKLYYLCRLSGWFVPKNAKHPQYAVAYNAVRRFFAIDTATLNAQKEACKAAGYSDLHIEQYAANWDYGTPVFEYCNLIGYNTVWRAFMNQTAWAQQIAMDTPEIEKNIKECLNLK